MKINKAEDMLQYAGGFKNGVEMLKNGVVNGDMCVCSWKKHDWAVFVRELFSFAKNIDSAGSSNLNT